MNPAWPGLPRHLIRSIDSYGTFLYVPRECQKNLISTRIETNPQQATFL